MAFVLLFFNPINFASAQSASELSVFQNIFDKMRLPIKRSENMPTIESYLKDKKWISVHLVSDKLNNIISNTPPIKFYQIFSSEIERICNNTKELRDRFNWLDVVERYIDKNKKSLFSFNTKESCKSSSNRSSTKKTRQELLEQLKNQHKLIKFPVSISEGISWVDIYLHKEKVIMYRYLLDDKLLQKLGKSLPTYLNSYLKSICSNKDIMSLKKVWDPFDFGHELVRANGEIITQFIINECD